MSKSIRFLGVAIMAWAGVRAVSLGLVPGAEALAFDQGPPRREALLPPIEPSLLPPIDALPSGTSGAAYHPTPYANQGYQPALASYPIYIPVPVVASGRISPPQIHYFSPAAAGPSEQHFYGTGMPAPARILHADVAMPVVPQITPSLAPPKRLPGLDRLSLSGWAVTRNQPGPDSLSNNGMLGGSEAGARLLWRFSPQLAASVRTSAPINSSRGAEGSVGVRYQPFLSLPVAVTVERRHGFRDYGRSAFAIFAEGGVYGRPLPWGAGLDGYFQAGAVDFNNPDWFLDGQLAVTRPVWRNVYAGLGAWGGAQPGLRRLDVGPRLSLNLGRGMRAHADYRLNVAGNAQPGSGATLTLAGDF